jgi:CheY-like chemotaxis protein
MTLVLIDDDPINNFVNQKVLRKQKDDWAMMDFTDPKKALDYLLKNQENLPAVILLDINMPILNGWQFLDELLKNSINVPVFMLTSSIAQEDMEKTKIYPMIRGYINKPLNDDKAKLVFKGF